MTASAVCDVLCYYPKPFAVSAFSLLLHSWSFVLCCSMSCPFHVLHLMCCYPATWLHTCICHFSPCPRLQLHAPSWVGIVWRTVVSGSSYSSAASRPACGLKCGHGHRHTIMGSVKISHLSCQRSPAFRVVAAQPKKRNKYMWIYTYTHIYIYIPGIHRTRWHLRDSR